ncbi:hypothetical protein K458DRAFT_196348 [Lentithecium fluviatile CBS 122367]|uniref:Uncharacterized protein n=1 Tax=Lentithecium fluviatile CBS 122367 TaxID=1168545 RepID=A0A6G1ICE3_9PLEO|nr:hypothetical protein K458DRAFT_196348 [Lentithecium fluviatile CBS 122367]
MIWAPADCEFAAPNRTTHCPVQSPVCRCACPSASVTAACAPRSALEHTKAHYVTPRRVRLRCPQHTAEPRRNPAPKQPRSTSPPTPAHPLYPFL